MINNNLKYRDFLHLFNLVSTQGTKASGKYEFSGISAQHDFDGYTCWLTYKDLTVSLLFHGKFEVEFDNKDTFTDFYKKANALIALT